MLNSEFRITDGRIGQIDRVRIELLDDEMSLMVRRADMPDEYENAFIADSFLPPLKEFLVHDHSLCLQAVVKVLA